MSQLLSIDGIFYVTRWLHYFFGIVWIGHLYYFNFTQGSFMAEADSGTKSGVLTKLLPRALYWFRWGAMWTMVTGLIMLTLLAHRNPGYFGTGPGFAISLGSVLALSMWANVWFIIWPKQQVVMRSAAQVAQGGAALPEAAGAGAKALLASRTNTMFSIPMLFYMGAASHLPPPVTPDSKVGVAALVLALIYAGLQYNGMKGKLGPLQTVKGVISCGFGLVAVIWIVMALFI